MKTKITFLTFLAIVFTIVFSAFTPYEINIPGDTKTERYIIYDDAVTTANDSLETEWIDIYGATQVELFLWIDDTVHTKYYVDYRYGAETEITLAVDSIKSVGTALTGISKGVILRGYGDTTIVNKIPGANQIRYRAYRQSDSETSGKHHAAIITRD